MPAPEPSLELARQVRAAFILQGTTLKGWCREQNMHFSNARNALVGSWNGPAAKVLRQRIVKASGLKLSA